MNTLEKEIKLGKVGISDEYKTFEDNQAITAKVALLAVKYDLTIVESNDLKINDTYYDTGTFEILNSKSTFRKRETIGGSEFTIKVPVSVNENSFERLEITEQIPKGYKEIEVFKKIVSENNLSNDIKPVVTIKNQRLEIVIEKEGVKIILCFDRYYFVSINLGKNSEPIHLIEIEYIIENDTENEEIIRSLIEDIKNNFHVNPETMTKYKQAINWILKL